MLHEEHPLDNYFRELIRRRRLELLRRKRAALKAVQAVVAMGGLRRRLGQAAGAFRGAVNRNALCGHGP